VRKHLSRIRRAAYLPARRNHSIGDVPGDQPSVIANGPTGA
jgi:glycerate-2-kinase